MSGTKKIGLRERRVRAFVDALDGHVATLVVEGATLALPRALLPEGLREGTWIEIRVKAIATPRAATAAEVRRRQLASEDDGGDFKL